MSDRLFKVADEEIYFQDAQESQEYARNNPGKVIVRNSSAIEETSNTSYVNKKTLKLTLSPKKILEYLNKHVISQDEAKKELAQVLYYHQLRTHYYNNKSISQINPLMLIGPTGSGKTFLVQKGVECIKNIFLHVDASSMVPEGIKGYSIENIGKDLMHLANDNKSVAQRAIVFLDEVDKLFFDNSSDLNYGQKVTHQLLRLLEGTKLKVPKDNMSDKYIEFDTSNILFILGGAFQPIVDDKLHQKKSVGFSRDTNEEVLPEITIEDLYKEDVPKELIGRLGKIINIQPLSEDDYYSILTKSESSPLQDFVNKIKFHGDDVQISDDTLKSVAKKATENELGARALRQILKPMFDDALFEAPEGEFKTHNIVFKDK